MLKNYIITAYPEVCTAYMMYYDNRLLARVATAERSFSKHKLIKKFFRSFMFQKEWVDLAINGKQTG